MHINEYDKKYFKSLELKPTEVREQMKLISYIHLVAAQTQIPINQIDMSKVTKRTGKLKDKKAINEYLFNIKNQKKESLIKKHIALSVVQHLANHFGKLGKAPEGDEIKKVRSHVKRFSTIYEKDPTCANEINLKRWQHKLHHMTQAKDYSNLAKQIMIICNEGFWTFKGIKKHEHDDNKFFLQFYTTNDVILSDINPRAGLNLRMNVGKFLLEISARLNDMNMPYISRSSYWIYPYENNHLIGDLSSDRKIIHPYVNEDSLCEGNSYRAIKQARINNDLPMMMRVIFATLSHYSSAGGPWRTLNDFIAESKPIEDQNKEDSLEDIAMKLSEQIEERDLVNNFNEITQTEEFQSISDDEEDEDDW